MRSHFTITRGFKALLLAGGVSTIALATPAYAQDSGASEDDGETAIIVTGSRIQRRDFEATSPIVSVDEDLLTQSSSAAIEDSLNKLPQFTPNQTSTQGQDIQPTATNTPGAATVSLRGIGANRNLVLLDGRRATPSNASGVVDISTIPSAAIQRVEVISGGASATYGADAVAGVTNFILKKDFNGLELDGRVGYTERGDGFEYQISGIMGADFDDGRGNVSIAMSTNVRESSFQRDRDWYTDLWADPNIAGTQFFLDRPGADLNGNYINPAVLGSIFADANPAVPSTGLTVYTNPNGSVWTGTSFASRGGLYAFDGDLSTGSQYKVDATGTLGQNNVNQYLVLPLTRYNVFARGDYEITDWLSVFGQGLFSHVETYTRNEPGPITGGWGVSVPHGDYLWTGNDYSPSSLLGDGVTTNPLYTAGGAYGLNCGPTGGCTASEVFPVPTDLASILDARGHSATPGEPGYIEPTEENPNPTQPVIYSNGDDNFALTTLMPDDRETFTDVQTYNLLAGFEGTIPGTDWTWEAFVNHGESSTYARQTGIYSLMRTRALLTSPNYGQGFDYQGNPGSGGFGASSATCTSGLNFFEGNEFSEDCLNAIRADLKNRSTMRQTIVEANFQGGLVDLPAGQVRAALGASYRELDYEFINDTLTTQGSSFLDQALGIYPSGDAFGKIDTKEVYAEVLVPLISDTPGIQQLDLELGGRISDYSTTGTSYTYKVLADWTVTDWLRVRGGYNRAERAPNIGELYLAAQQTFGFNYAGDPCSLANPLPWSANGSAAGTNGNAANVEAMCRILMEQTGNANADEQYYGNVQDPSTFGFAFPTLVGNPNLEPEKADTWTAGFVINSPFTSPALSRLRLSVDWFDINVKDAIGAQSVASALQQCFDPALNPLAGTDPAAAAASFFCQNVPRNQTGALGNVLVTYTNNGRFHVQGIDAQLDWGMEVGPGMLGVNVLFNYLMDFESSTLPQLPMVDYAGTLGPAENGLNGGNYEYRVLTNLSYSIDGLMLGLQWRHLPSIEDATEASYPTPTTGAPAYNLFNLNGSYAMTDNLNIRFGVDNLFDKAPPRTGVDTSADTAVGQLPGGSFQNLYYDTIGRRFYLGANVKF